MSIDRDLIFEDNPFKQCNLVVYGLDVDFYNQLINHHDYFINIIHIHNPFKLYQHQLVFNDLGVDSYNQFDQQYLD